MSGQRLTVSPEQVQRVTVNPRELSPLPVREPQGSPLFDSAINLVGQAGDAATFPVRHPLEFLKSLATFPYQLIQAHAGQGQQMGEAFQRGDIREGLWRGAASIVPFAGPLMANYFDADQAGKEEIAGNIIGGAALGRVPIPRRIVPSFRRSMDPADAGAIDAARASGVPVDAGVATGNRPLTSMIEGAERTTATGAGAVNRAQQATQGGLEQMGSGLAQETGAPKLTMAQAGEGSLAALTQKAAGHRAVAEQNYSLVQQAEAAGTLPPVSFARVRTLLKPMHDYLTQLNDATGGLDAATGRGRLKADLDAIMLPQVERGYGYVAGDVPVMTAERILSNVKELLRNAQESKASGVTTGQLRTIVKTLQGQIDDALKADPAALQAMQDARLNTAQKFTVEKLLEKLQGADQTRSPITAMEDLVSPGGYRRLQRLAVQSPEAVQNLGRAWFEDRFSFLKDKDAPFKTMANEWAGMADETKRILFREALAKDPNYLSRVDEFFRAAGKIQENFNPSGSGAAAANIWKLFAVPVEMGLGAATGHLGEAAAVGAGIVAQDLGANLFARAMNNPRVVQLMVEGLRLPGQATAARARNLAAIQTILNAGVTPPAQTGAGTVGQTETPRTGRAGGPGPLSDTRLAQTPERGGVTVVGRDGKTYSFPTQAQADKFKAAGG